jgi:hypothetical protein
VWFHNFRKNDEAKMKILICIILFVGLVPIGSIAQLKKDAVTPKFNEILAKPNSDFLFGLLDPSRMHMSHVFSMSYGAFGSQGVMLNTYVNTIDFQISDRMNLRTNFGIMASPYHTLGENFYFNEPRFFGGAMLNYRVTDNSNIIFQFQVTPYQYFYQPMLGDSYFGQHRFGGF